MPKIDTLIEGRDSFELIGDELASILAIEVAEQKRLAQQDGQDPSRWDLRIFHERINPWDEFPTVSDEEEPSVVEPTTPIVNVSFETGIYDESASDLIERQRMSATYHVDCYGYGVSEVDTKSGGHIPGDLTASRECYRAVRLVRRILMSGHYASLGQPPASRFVWRRWLQSVSAPKRLNEEQQIYNLRAARMVFQVQFNEFSPQVQPTEMDLFAAKVNHLDSGELLFELHFPSSEEEENGE